MMDAVIAIERLTAGKTLEEYCANPDLAASVERYLERLSEASRHIPEALKQDRPHVDWRGVADVGNVLRHAYDQVVDPRVWEIVEIDLPPIKTAVDDMMREVDRGDGD
jgi:uncharacterized protein with HEPN domain